MRCVFAQVVLPGALIGFCLPWVMASGPEGAPAATVAMPCHPVPDGTVGTAPRGSPELPEFVVLGMHDFEMDVVEHSSFPGLPPVEGRIRLRVHSVADPGLPVLAQGSDGDRQSAPWKETKAPAAEGFFPRMAFVSAWVFEGPVSLVRCRLDGPEEEDLLFWSNVDFRHFGGVGSFQAQEVGGDLRMYGLLLAVDEVSDAGERERILSWLGLDWAEVPLFSMLEPQFAGAREGGFSGAAAWGLVRDMHALYRDHGQALASAHAGRQEQWEARRAEALANPPRPQDVNVFFWRPDGTPPGKEGDL